jgi:hypothetical protein
VVTDAKWEEVIEPKEMRENIERKVVEDINKKDHL